MLHVLGTAKELFSRRCNLPQRVLAEVFQGLMILDAEYEPTRDYLQVGGYSLIVENIEDIPLIKNYVDYDRHPPEWVTKISDTGYSSALFVMNDDLSIMVFMPISILPTTLLKELED